MKTNRLKSINLILYIIALYGTDTVIGSTLEGNSSSSAHNSADGFHLLPSNNNNSIQYHLYIPEHPKGRCYFEPDVSNICAFNTSYKFKILIHGYSAKLLPGNFFEQIKDSLLSYDKYNVIIVNWTKYNGDPYSESVRKAYTVAINIGKMVNFLVKKGVNPLDVHIIGHSLGAHIAGVAGKQVSSLGRVTGLDPAGPLFTKSIKYNRLTNESANFVDVIHTSNDKRVLDVGLGFYDAIGSIDFYPNGGNIQPACQIGQYFRNSDGQVIRITSLDNVGSCYHNKVLLYFLNSIHRCNYTSKECKSYEMYSAGKCDFDSNPTNRKGLYSKLIPGLPTESTFYLDTSEDAPFCEKERKQKVSEPKR